MVHEVKETNQVKETNEKTANPEQKQFLNVHRVYVKAMSFEASLMTLELPTDQKKLNLEMQLNISSSARGNDLYEGVLTITLTGKHETNLLWRMQLQEAGLFTIKGFEKDQLETILNVFCINIIYPYACSVIYQAVTQAGFQAIHLGPMNFEVIYQEKQKKQKEEESKKFNGGSKKLEGLN